MLTCCKQCFMRDKAESFRTKILRRTVEVKVSAVKGSKVLGSRATPQGQGSEPLRRSGATPLTVQLSHVYERQSRVDHLWVFIHFILLPCGIVYEKVSGKCYDYFTSESHLLNFLILQLLGSFHQLHKSNLRQLIHLFYSQRL